MAKAPTGTKIVILVRPDQPSIELHYLSLGTKPEQFPEVKALHSRNGRCYKIPVQDFMTSPASAPVVNWFAPLCYYCAPIN